MQRVKVRRIALVGLTVPLAVYRCKCFLGLKRARRVEPLPPPTPDELELAKARRFFLVGNYRQARVILRPLRPRMSPDNQDWMHLDSAVRLLAVKDSIEQVDTEFKKLSDEGIDPEQLGSWTRRLCRGKYEDVPPAINASDWIGSLLLLDWLEQYQPGNGESASVGERKAQLQRLQTWMTVEQVGDQGVALYDRLLQASNLQSALGQVTQVEVDALQARCQLPAGRFWRNG
jgi:hypothetical protein